MKRADSITSPQQSRLGIIHLLGWMAGCAAVLAVYRANTDWSRIPAEYQMQLKLQQLAFGLLYGTAISGLGLLFWRKWTRGLPFPTQPGHWVLVLGGVGFLIDGSTALLALLFAHWFQAVYGDVFYFYYPLQQSIAWSVGALIALAILIFGRGSRHWRLFTVLALLMILANALTHSFELFCLHGQAYIPGFFIRGNWPRYIPLWTRVIGESACVLSVPLLIWLDRRCGYSRDWLHWTGISVGTGLALLDIGNHIWILMYL